MTQILEKEIKLFAIELLTHQDFKYIYASNCSAKKDNESE